VPIATTASPERTPLPRIVAIALNGLGACSKARSLVSSLETSRSFSAASPLRLPEISPTQPSTTWWLVTTWPLLLITKPVPVWLMVLPGFKGGEFGAEAGAAAAAGFAATANSPAAATPFFLTLRTQLSSAGNNCAVWFRLN